MNHKLISACFVASALALPVAAYSADMSKKDSGMKKETVKESIKDTVITAKIKGEYAKDKTVSAMNIGVDTDGAGVVTLTGNAKSKAEADKAVEIAKSTKGVSSVTNNIKVDSTASAGTRPAK